MTRVYECSYKHCRSTTRKAFDRLNLGYDGLMIRVINALKGDKREVERKDARVVYAKQGKAIVGWAILVAPAMYDHRRDSEVFLYVEKKRRRQGIGSLLMLTARKHWGQHFKVCNYESTSHLFFTEIGEV